MWISAVFGQLSFPITTSSAQQADSEGELSKKGKKKIVGEQKRGKEGEKEKEAVITTIIFFFNARQRSGRAKLIQRASFEGKKNEKDRGERPWLGPAVGHANDLKLRCIN